nr:hypothetical protein [Ardenticatena sp.]
MSTMKTLDYLAMATSHKIAEVIGKRVKNTTVQARDLETLATKALGVLQSQGIYAMALFLFSRSGKETKEETKEEKMSAEERVATQILSWLWPLRDPHGALGNLQKNENQPQTDKGFDEINQNKCYMLQEWADLSSDLPTLLLVRDLYEQTLIYTRYHAKASKGE